ncbi:FAD-dependent oxidoreductase [candidate division KSB1 bacterium]
MNGLKKTPENIIVIGASAAGLKAACRARRLLPQSEVTVIESGKYISYAACGLPYYLSGDIEDFDDLRKTPYELIKDPDYFASIKDVTVLTHLCADRISKEQHTLCCHDVNTGTERIFPYDTLVIATGASPVIPDIPGNDLPGISTFTNADDAIELKKACESGKINSVVVVGAGYIGIELCEAFSALWGIEVTLIEQESHILSGFIDSELAVKVEEMLKDEGVNVITGTRCTGITQNGSGLSVHTDGITCDTVFDRVLFCTGIKPNIGIAIDAGLKTGETGGITVDDNLRTSDPDIYAGGDCVEIEHRLTGKQVLFPLGSIANRMGRVIGNNIAGKERTFAPIVGSSVLKAFDWNIASVGLTATKAREAGFNTGEAWGVFDDKAHFYPDAEVILVKMVFDTQTEQILGAQAAGKGDVVRRIDAISALMQKEAVIDDLFDFEPAYAPPYSGPLDPLHFMAFEADAVLHEGLKPESPADVETILASKPAVLDVRTETERNSHPLPKGFKRVYEIPLDRLRDSIGTIQTGQNILAVCQRGTRSYEAVRIMRENGMSTVSFLGGGMLFARSYNDL